MIELGSYCVYFGGGSNRKQIDVCARGPIEALELAIDAHQAMEGWEGRPFDSFCDRQSRVIAPWPK